MVKLPRRWVLRLLRQLTSERLQRTHIPRYLPSAKHLSSSSQDKLTAPEEAAAVAQLPQFIRQPMNVNCHSFWFSLTSQDVIRGSSNCVGKQLLTNNWHQRKADTKEMVCATSWWIRLWNWSSQILIFDQVKSVLWSNSHALTSSIQKDALSHLYRNEDGEKMDCWIKKNLAMKGDFGLYHTAVTVPCLFIHWNV